MTNLATRSSTSSRCVCVSVEKSTFRPHDHLSKHTPTTNKYWQGTRKVCWAIGEKERMSENSEKLEEFDSFSVVTCGIQDFNSSTRETVFASFD